MAEVSVRVTINGREVSATVEPRLLLVDYIRDVARLTGTHVGCDTSNCGACTILLEGASVKACTLFAVQADGLAVTTIEGIADGERWHPVQEAFREHHGLQCGFCTPGMVISSVHLLGRNPDPTEAEVRRGIAGNLCRCTGYQNIVDSVRAAGGAMRSGTGTAPGGTHGG